MLIIESLVKAKRSFQPFRLRFFRWSLFIGPHADGLGADRRSLRGAALMWCSTVRFPTGNGLDWVVGTTGFVPSVGHGEHYAPGQHRPPVRATPRRHACLRPEHQFSWIDVS